jgi:hypothetical protein
MAEPCVHAFASQVTVEDVTPPNGLTPYQRACVRVWCTVCDGVLMATGLPPLDPVLFRTVALSPDGKDVYLSGLLVTPPVLRTATPAEASREAERPHEGAQLRSQPG